jgi:predicted O-methyltransferase YrrM
MLKTTSKKLFNLSNISNKDKKLINEISLATKCSGRVKSVDSLNTQPKIIYSLCKLKEAETLFEVGTGRGTSDLSVSLLENIKKIVTLDIVPFEKKRDTFCNFKKVHFSNKDFYDLINIDTKTKIDFLNMVTDEDSSIRYKCKLFPKENYKNFFDICFIDGNHKIDKYILNDYKVSKYILKNDGFIIFDDYGPDWAVTRVVDKILKENDNLIGILINTMKQYLNWGHVIIIDKNNKFLEKISQIC